MEFIHRPVNGDTIVALATPAGVGGVAIVRLSGGSAKEIAARLASPSVCSQPSHTVRVYTIHTPHYPRLDTALICVMDAPKSFTGESVVEIHCHGGRLIAHTIIDAAVAYGARPARPGEFSFRAFMHGKIDLTQAEAIQDVVCAHTEKALMVAQEHLAGTLSKHIERWQQRATDVAAILEAWVDFPEEDLAFCSFDEAIHEIGSLQQEIDSVIATFEQGHIVRDGVSVCIIGAPNVGKSSIMNLLLGKDRSIVSPIAGTTRDSIEEALHLNGLYVRVTDTAGLRESGDIIEQEGVKRSLRAQEAADVILAVLDSSRPDDVDMLTIVADLPRDRTVVIWNKEDIACHELPVIDSDYIVHLSATTGAGYAECVNMIQTVIWKQAATSNAEVMITSCRHKEALSRASASLARVRHAMSTQLSPEFIAMDMHDVLMALGEVIGTNVTEDILDTIFSKFCIGK